MIWLWLSLFAAIAIFWIVGISNPSVPIVNTGPVKQFILLNTGNYDANTYDPAATETLTGNGSLLVLSFEVATTGPIVGIPNIYGGGKDYKINDTFTIVGGNSNAIGKVTEID